MIVKLHVLSCGHGDTLLLQMPKRKWALIDCHLPGKQALQRFFQFAQNLEIKTLDYVVLTHPDSDHYTGMADVLEHFSTAPHNVRFYCDAGASHQHVIKLLQARRRPRDEVNEYVRLIKTILRLQNDGKIERQWLNNQTATIRISGRRQGLSLVVVGPVVSAIAGAQDRALLDLGKLPDINELSVVLVAQIVTRLISCRMFLPGDMEGDGMSQALARWDTHPDNIGPISTFDVIKAPHHGSVNGHDLQLANRIPNNGRGVLSISCGTSYDLPSRKVIADYLDRGWDVYCTMPRVAQSKPINALQGMHTRGRNSESPASYDLTVSAIPFLGLRAQPIAAKVEQRQLAAYV
jgi:beta-lactamase superfamily II metal-dependent hydrolase